VFFISGCPPSFSNQVKAILLSATSLPDLSEINGDITRFSAATMTRPVGHEVGLKIREKELKGKTDVE